MWYFANCFLEMLVNCRPTSVNPFGLYFHQKHNLSSGIDNEMSPSLVKTELII